MRLCVSLSLSLSLCPCLSVSLRQDYPYAWTIDDPELLLNGYYHAPNKLYSQCSAAPGYNTPCPAGGMGRRITPSFMAINASLEAEIPLADQQLADKAVETLGKLRNRSTAHQDTPPWFVAVGFHLPHIPDIVPQRFLDLYPDEEVRCLLVSVSVSLCFCLCASLCVPLCISVSLYVCLCVSSSMSAVIFPQSCLRQVELPDYPYAPVYMPPVAWSSSGELNQYSDVRAMHASGAINHTRPTAWVREFRRHYYAAVSYLDHNVGRVLAALEANSQQDDTVVAFWGDVRAQAWQLCFVSL